MVFDASGSQDPDGSIVSYNWEFGDGATHNGATAIHAYSSSAPYTVRLTVTDNSGASDTITRTVVVQAAGMPALAVQMTLPKTTYEVGESITITYAINRTAYVYLCEVDTEGRVVLLYPNWVERSNPVDPGTHTIPGSAYALRISAPIGSETLYLFAATSPLPNFPASFSYGFPVLSTNHTSFRNAVLSAMQTQISSGEWAYDDASFQVTSSTPTVGILRVLSSPSGASVRLDGSTIGTTPIEISNVASGAHSIQISRAGYVTVTHSAIVTAGLLTTVNISLTPISSNQPPIVAFTFAPAAPGVGESVSFNATSSYDPDGAIVSYAWDLDGNGVDDAFSPTMTACLRRRLKPSSLQQQEEPPARPPWALLPVCSFGVPILGI